MKAILIGYGEIGKAVYTVFSKNHQIQIQDLRKSNNFNIEAGTKADILIITIPYSENFVRIVKNYKKRFKIKSTLIFSTTAIGTCRQLKAVHSPVEGKHPYLVKSIRKGKRWIGGVDFRIMRFFREAGFKKRDIFLLADSEWTEFLKLRSTSLYGLNIEFARYSNKVASKLKMPFATVRRFNNDYNVLYKKLGMSEYSRYILNPPKGKIGGHCILPNAKILNNDFPHVFLDEILKRKKA